MFPSHRWLCKDEADGKVEVELYPSEILDIEKCNGRCYNVVTPNRQLLKVSSSPTVINYEVTVVTGDVRTGGTNANVSCQLYGEEGKSEVLALRSRSNNFERGTTEIFKVCKTPVSSRPKRDLGLTPASITETTARGSRCR